MSIAQLAYTTFIWIDLLLPSPIPKRVFVTIHVLGKSWFVEDDIRCRRQTLSENWELVIVRLKYVKIRRFRLI